MEQAADGVQPKKSIVKGARRLLQLSSEAEERYLAGKMSPKELLELTASHYDNEHLVKTLNALIPAETLVEPDSNADDSLNASKEKLLDIRSSAEVMEDDDREKELAKDEDLTDMDADHWEPQLWENTSQGIDIVKLGFLFW